MVLKKVKKNLKKGVRSASDQKIIENKRKLINKLVKDGKEGKLMIIKTTIKDIMSTDLKTLSPDDNIGYALELFSEYAITGAPVVKKDKVVGLISQTDIIRLMSEKKLFDTQEDKVNINELQKMKIKDFMIKKIFFINQNEKLTDACRLMAEKRIHRLLVQNSKKELVGIITMEDVIMGLSAEFFVESIHEATDRVIESEIDTLLDIIQRREKISVDELVKEMNLKESHIQNLAKILEKRGLIKIEYGIFGSPVLKANK
ncbi:MAG: CBS domain-containing protein [Candidatus Aenigmarchaeota archaeon]|nr:CBS domain-containing protein [Candidatus Aenigmarchaeota archaeon]